MQTTNVTLENVTAKKYEENIKLRSEIKNLKYLVSYFKALKFARSSEKLPPADQKQLFDEAESIADQRPQDVSEETIEIKSFKRKRGGRKIIPAEIPREKITHDISEPDKICNCGEPLSKTGEEITEKLDIVPAKITVIQHVRPKYACFHCLNKDKSAVHFKIADLPQEILPKSIASAGLFAHILTNKFCDHLPYYRQESIFARHGIDISRANMSNCKYSFMSNMIVLRNLCVKIFFKLLFCWLMKWSDPDLLDGLLSIYS